jgi:hypothetical protein
LTAAYLWGEIVAVCVLQGKKEGRGGERRMKGRERERGDKNRAGERVRRNRHLHSLI